MLRPVRFTGYCKPDSGVKYKKIIIKIQAVEQQYKRTIIIVDINSIEDQQQWNDTREDEANNQTNNDNLKKAEKYTIWKIHITNMRRGCTL